MRQWSIRVFFLVYFIAVCFQGSVLLVLMILPCYVTIFQIRGAAYPLSTGRIFGVVPTYHMPRNNIVDINQLEPTCFTTPMLNSIFFV